MNHELVAALTAERFGPLAEVILERTPAVVRRRRILLAPNPADAFMPPRQRVEIGADVAALAARGWTAEQIASVLAVDRARVRRLLPAGEHQEVDADG